MVVVLQRYSENLLHVSEHQCQNSLQLTIWWMNTYFPLCKRSLLLHMTCDTWFAIYYRPHVMALKINVRPVLVNLKYWVYIALRFIVHRNKSKSMLTEFIQLHHEPKHDEWTGWIMSPTTTNEIKYSAGQLNTLVSVSLILSDHITTDSTSVLSSL